MDAQVLLYCIVLAAYIDPGPHLQAAEQTARMTCMIGIMFCSILYGLHSGLSDLHVMKHYSAQAGYDSIECFAGQARLTWVLQVQGYRATAVDIGHWDKWADERRQRGAPLPKSGNNPLDFLGSGGFALFGFKLSELHRFGQQILLYSHINVQFARWESEVASDVDPTIP